MYPINMYMKGEFYCTFASLQVLARVACPEARWDPDDGSSIMQCAKYIGDIVGKLSDQEKAVTVWSQIARRVNAILCESSSSPTGNKDAAAHANATVNRYVWHARLGLDIFPKIKGYPFDY